MTAYNGTFSVHNNTGTEITNLVVIHQFGPNSSTPIRVINYMCSESIDANADSSLCTLTSETGLNDYWSVYFTVNTTAYYLQNFAANYSYNDSQGDSTNCLIVLTLNQASFTMPTSAPCNGTLISAATSFVDSTESV